MVLERLTGRKEAGKVRQEKEPEPQFTPEKLAKAPWYIKLPVNLKIRYAETDPFKLLMMLIVISFLGFIIAGFMLPWMEVVEEIPNQIPILSIFSGLTAGIFIADRMGREVRENVCEVSLDGKTYLVDNRKVDIYEGGHIVYLVNFYGKPLLNEELDNMRRWGEQRTMFIPKLVLEQFDSILGRRAKAYPDCRLKSVYMKDVDQGIMYIPRKLSETRLLKKLEASEENLNIYHEMVEKFKGDALKIVHDLRGHESELLKALITNMNSLQQAMWGTPEKMRNLINVQLQRRQFGSYNRGSSYNRYNPSYNRYGSFESGKPPWSDISPVDNTPTNIPTGGESNE